MSVEEAWKEWVDSESGAACLDPDPIANQPFPAALTRYELRLRLNYRLRAAFVAGWSAKEEAAK